MGGGTGLHTEKTSAFLHSLPLLPAAALTVALFLGGGGGGDLVYLRVTAEGCGDNGHTLNDAFKAPQVDSLHPGA